MRIALFLRSYGFLYASAVLFGMYFPIYAWVWRTAPVLMIFVLIGIQSFIALWTVHDARSRQCTPCFDFGTFIYFTWFLTVPCYLVATRGWRGLIVVLTTFFTMVITTLITIIGIMFLMAGLGS